VDNEQRINRGRTVEDLKHMPGWEYIEDELKNEIKSVTSSLKNGNFSNLSEVTRLQGKDEGLNFILNKLEGWIKEKNQLEQGYR